MKTKFVLYIKNNEKVFIINAYDTLNEAKRDKEILKHMIKNNCKLLIKQKISK